MSTENKLENILPTKEEMENKRNEYLKKDLETLREFLLSQKTDSFPRNLETSHFYFINIKVLSDYLNSTKSIYKIFEHNKTNCIMYREYWEKNLKLGQTLSMEKF